MKIKGEKTIMGKTIRSPEHFIEDLSDRINGITTKIVEIENEKMQLGMLLGFLKGFAGRLNRVCER
jgi:hypothetical protein